MTPQEVLRMQEKKLDAQATRLGDQSARIDALAKMIGGLEKVREGDMKKLREFKLALNFRELVKARSQFSFPFHYIREITLPANSTNRVTATITTSPGGWFFADRVFASYRVTEGVYSGTWRPLAHSDPAIAVDANVADVIDFTWDYQEARTNRARQNDAQVIPGDLLFRRDSDGYLLGGDPWAPATNVTIGVTPLASPAHAGVIVFTFLGEQCDGAQQDAMEQWSLLKKSMGLIGAGA